MKNRFNPRQNYLIHVDGVNSRTVTLCQDYIGLAGDISGVKKLMVKSNLSNIVNMHCIHL